MPAQLHSKSPSPIIKVTSSGREGMMTWQNGNFEAGLFTPAYISSRYAGMAAGYLVTGLISCPAIFIDWFKNHLSASLNHAEPRQHPAEYEICTYDIPYMLVNEELKKLPLYRGGFFAKYPLGLAGEIVGGVVNAVVAAGTFAVVGILELGLAFGACVTMLMLSVGAAFIGGIYCLSRCYQVGVEETCVETLHKLNDYF